MTIQRKMIFISRSSEKQSLAFIEVFFDELMSTHKNLSNQIDGDIEHKKNQLIFNWNYPTSILYELVTLNLYIEGELKNLFKKVMIEAKRYKIAFAMPSINLKLCQNFPDNVFAYQRWYSENVPLGAKPFDATPGQKIAVKALIEYFKTDLILLSSTVFDFDHQKKHSYNIYCEKSEQLNNEIRMIHAKYGDHIYKKVPYDQEHGIEYIESELMLPKHSFRNHYFNPECFLDTELKNEKLFIFS